MARNKKPKRRKKRNVGLARVSAGAHYMVNTGWDRAIDNMMQGDWAGALRALGGQRIGTIISASVPAVFVKGISNAVGSVPVYSTRNKTISIFGR